MPLLRFFLGMAEWVVYEALGGLSPAPADAMDDGGGDPFA